jgi:oligopeptide transport system substrate-binding protein
METAWKTSEAMDGAAQFSPSERRPGGPQRTSGDMTRATPTHSVVSVALLAAILCTGCSRPDHGYFGTVKPAHGPNEIWINNSTEPETLDPTLCSDSAGGEIIWNVFAGLVQAHPATLEPCPDVATHWDVSDDGRTYTFHLRPSVWSDGVPLTAHDFVYAFRRLVDPKTASKYASNGHLLKGGAAITAGEAHPESLAVRAIDDLTLEVTLEEPVPYAMSMLTFYSFMPIPRHLMASLEARGIEASLWTRPEHVVCNGPYTMTEWRFRQHMIFEKNPRYWDAANVRLDRVRLSMVESETTALAMYAAGEFDWPGHNSALPFEFMDYVAEFKDFSHHTEWRSYFYWINTTRPPLDNPLLRQALSMAIDRESLVRHITRGGQTPTATLAPEGMAGYRGPSIALFDPDEARRLLAEAGYAKGSEVPPITLSYNTSEGHKQIAEAIQQMWKKELGIAVDLENLEWNVFLDKAARTDFQICRMGWSADYDDPFNFLEILSSASGNNHSNWKNPDYDGLLGEANRCLDPAKRLAILRDAEAMAMAAQPVIPIYIGTSSKLLKPYVRGLWPNAQVRHPWKFLWIDEQFDPERPSRPDPPPPPCLGRRDP